MEIKFDDAKRHATTILNRLADFIVPLQGARGVSGSYDIIELMKWEQTLRTIESKVNKLSSPFPCRREAEEIFRFGSMLTLLIPELETQLQAFWNMWHEVIDMWSQSPNMYQDFSWWNIDVGLNQRMLDTDIEANKIVTSAVQNPNDLTVASALLNTHVARTEAIEYVMYKIIDNAVKTFSLESKYNVAQLCSVTTKVRKGNEWRSDIRAIRDAVSHKKYTLSDGQPGWILTFNNSDHGYNFTKVYKGRDFIHFFDKHTLLFKFQIMLLNVIELLSLFSNFLCS